MRFKQILATIPGMAFVVLAALQYSRPDAVLWIAAFLVAAIFSFMAAIEKISRALLLVASVAYLAASFYLWPIHPEASGFANGVIMQEGGSLEVLGFMVASLSMLIYAILYRSKTRLHPPYVAGRLKKWAS